MVVWWLKKLAHVFLTVIYSRADQTSKYLPDLQSAGYGGRGKQKPRSCTHLRRWSEQSAVFLGTLTVYLEVDTPPAFSLMSKIQTEFGDRQWVILNSIRWRLQLYMLKQMWIRWLSTQVYLLVWCTATEGANTSFSISSNEKDLQKLSFSGWGEQYTPE